MLQSPPFLAASVAALLSAAFAACSASTASSREVDPPDDFAGGMSLLVEPGTVDVEDIYLPAVRIDIGIDRLGEIVHGYCSGVLIHPRVVLTAGHCVCLPRPPDPQEKVALGKSRKPAKEKVVTRAEALRDADITSITDKRSPCAEAVIVNTVRYGKPGETRATHQYPGSVRLHPEFEVVHAAKEGQKTRPLWNSADLAAIILAWPVPSDVKPLSLPKSEVKVGEAVVMVGYGTRDEKDEKLRRSGKNEVTQVDTQEPRNVLFGAAIPRGPKYPEPAHGQPGDSGGACVKEGKPDVLLGIVTMGPVASGDPEVSYFTSIFPHLDWLSKIIQEADLAVDAGVPPSPAAR